MNIRVNTQDIELPARGVTALRDRIRRAFMSVADCVTALHVTLKDVNGPRGGRGKVCVLRAELTDGGQVLIVHRSRTMRRALVRCLRRGRRKVRGEVQRRRRRRRSRRTLTQLDPAPQPAA
ncbi:MAG: hypothetical protein QNJ73_03495 [Gammaproteobacteria bacterium]|nr:hypothetical protein [Gammaproteobacteria bacterium]